MHARRLSLVLILLQLPGAARAAEADAPYWVEPMKKVHDRFKGTPATLPALADSITFTMAFWAPLHYEPKKMSTEMTAARDLVKKHLKEDCWAKWKGPDYGNNSSMTIRWADENVDKWLKKLNP